MNRPGMPRAAVLAGLLALAGAAPAQQAEPEWHVLQAGTVHGGEAPAKPGDGWLALKVIDGKWHLVPAVVTAMAVRDEVVGGPDDLSAVRIDVDVAGAIALLRAPGLVAGKVDTPDMRFKDNVRELGPDESTLAVNFKGRAYRFVVHHQALDLRLDGQSTRLSDNVGDGGDITTGLVWAGDLDGDGALDFLLEGTGFNNDSLCLYLSRGAPAGKLVQLSGCQNATGC